MVTPLVAVDVIGGGYLLWGRALGGGPPGWTTLAAARIGSLPVPVPGSGAGDRITLTYLEYVAVEPIHGNAYIAEERLTGLRRTQAAQPTGGSDER
jgi:CRISPR-associated protein (TIGR03984 family)